MKLAIKITLLVLVAGGIAAALFFLTKKTSGGDDIDELTLTPFVEYIEQRIAEEVEDNDYEPATEAYNDILEEIATEAFATQADGSRTLSRASEKHCRKEAFKAYVDIFTDHANSYFRQSEWVETYIDSLKGTAEAMLADSMLQPIATNARRNLTAVVTTVTDYHEAWRIARSATECTTIEAAREVKRKAATYQRAPLSNNTALMAALSDAENQAKTSLSNYIMGRCNHLAANYYTYASYEAFTQEYTRVSNLASAYKNEFGQNTLPQASTTLRRADQAALDYFSGRRSNAGRNSGGNNGSGNSGRNNGSGNGRSESGGGYHIGNGGSGGSGGSGGNGRSERTERGGGNGSGSSGNNRGNGSERREH
ncbi:MAG: hypothetical protein IJT98_02715 [Prevotella sp.]|nr:hypothetical protein [Prevotella sp.]